MAVLPVQTMGPPLVAFLQCLLVGIDEVVEQHQAVVVPSGLTASRGSEEVTALDVEYVMMRHFGVGHGVGTVVAVAARDACSCDLNEQGSDVGAGVAAA